MNQIKSLLLWGILIISFCALVIALTNIWPENPLKEYKIPLVVIFIAMGGLMRHRIKKIFW